ncbi:hypothetical protein [Paracoccus sp. (in: a-proteobacteria)]|uniref:hypothetical protein n=1 Tax=Paracoccus sp. TaxID=267 RepID=UPI0035AF1453
MSNIRVVIADIRERTERVYLSADEHSNGDHHRRWKAIREGEAELANYLRATYDARISEKPWTNTIRMCGVSSSATAGLLAAFRNWAAAAERKADAS